MKGICLLVCSMLVLAPREATAIMPGGSAFCGTDCVARGGGERPAAAVILTQAAADDFVVADVRGDPVAPIPLQIDSMRREADDDLFALKGLPPQASLSKGGRINDVWIVRRKDIRTLAVTVPKDYSGTFEVSVSRAQTPLRPKLTRAFTVAVIGKPLDTPTNALAIEPSAIGPGDVIPYVQNAADRMLLERASAQLEKGDISGARAIFEVLAAKGNPVAALALGETYDPRILSRIYVKGVEPDENKAEEWYRKAASWGNARAQSLIGTRQ